MADIVVTANIVTVPNVFWIAKDAVTNVAAARIPAFPLFPTLSFLSHHFCVDALIFPDPPLATTRAAADVWSFPIRSLL